ncbi:inactive purple acid phosphatase-like protein [Senna tora]|uniref:Inactive purple acid phosphatase-like protein n=1 Tax=Senna tora TaxID=362788 RepID=A0A834TW51_9FABA|nr:inactive purple acid phosphatase-like protein [Senna tora]
MQGLAEVGEARLVRFFSALPNVMLSHPIITSASPLSEFTAEHECGIRIWDLRKPKVPTQELPGHTHWTWTVKSNPEIRRIDLGVLTCPRGEIGDTCRACFVNCNVDEWIRRRLLPLHKNKNHVLDPRKRRKLCFERDRVRVSQVTCCCSDSITPIRSASCEKTEEWRFDPKKSSHRVRVQASPAMPFASPQSFVKQEKFYPRCTPRNSGPQSRDTPPKRDTGIANEKDWGISLLNENVNESGTNEDGSTWYRESGEELGKNGYRCRWTRMGGRSHDGSSEWKETWWEKSDWTGYKELGVEKSGRNAEGDSWWETWQENLHQDEWSNIARIERSAQKQAKSGTENAGWYEKWWEKYDAKGWTEKGAHKYGRLNEQSWTDKWAETELGTKWGDKWEERFFEGIGSRHGETWHVSPSNEHAIEAWAIAFVWKAL